MRARSCLVVAASMAACALLTACQAGSTTPTAASSSTSRSAPTSTPSSTPTPSPAVPAVAVPTAAESAAQSAGQSALQQAQAAASSARVAVSPPASSAPATKARQADAAWPPEVAYPVEGRVWVVYLAVARNGSAAERSRLEATLADVRTHGYAAAGGVGAIACEQGAAEALGVDPQAKAAPVFFATRAQAQQFAARWNRPYAGYAQVTENCIA